MRLRAASSLFFVTIASVIGCSTPSEEPAAQSQEAPLVKDAAHMTQRPDGNWDVLCKDGKQEIVSTAQILANDVCAPAGPVACIKKCAARWSDGSCKNYGPDYCAAAPVCIPQVSERWTDASVKNYGPDFCVSGGSPTCIVSCSARWTDGSCKAYGADKCSKQPIACVKNCDARWTDGSCKSYGPDFCKEGTPAPTCTQFCSARWADGSCKAYGPDLCQ